MLSSTFAVVITPPEIVIGCDLNVCLAPSREGLTGSRIHPNANSASSRWREAVTEWMHSLRLRALFALLNRVITFLSRVWNGIMTQAGRKKL